MTLRERIADWISGGELTRQKVHGCKWKGLYTEAMKDRAAALCAEDLYRERCWRIASLETPRCAHIGKRMARIARGEE